MWERLLTLTQERAGGIELGMAFLDGTNVRAHAKAAGTPKRGVWTRTAHVGATERVAGGRHPV